LDLGGYRAGTIVPIPGTRREDQLNEKLGAINIELTPADLREIESAFSAVRVQGVRMSEKHMQRIDQS
jgi:aryl-alcohol dehydrogenase-like predicted oxidoreductase